MTMNIRYFLLMSFYFQSHFVMSQTANQVLFNDNDNIQKISKGGGGYLAVIPIYEGIEGSPVLFEWTPATIVIKGKSSLNGHLVSYDVSRNVFLARVRSQVLEIDHLRLDTIIVGRMKFVTINDQYFEVIGNGKIPLLKKYTAEVRKPDYIPALDTGSKVSRWEISNSYFIRYNSALHKVSLSKASIKKELDLDISFVKEMERIGLKFNSAEDLVQILEFLSEKL